MAVRTVVVVRRAACWQRAHGPVGWQWLSQDLRLTIGGVANSILGRTGTNVNYVLSRSLTQ